MEHFDVVIIGAGPAGLKCAELLGGSSYKTVLIEKSDTIGTKICAGGVTVNPGLPDYMLQKINSFRRQYVILNGKEYIFDMKNPLMIIDREALGKFQLDLIKDYKNIMVEKGTKVTGIVNDGDGIVPPDESGKSKKYIVTSQGEKIGFTFLVGADGSQSITRKFLGLESKFHIGAHYKIPVVFDKMVWFLNPERLGTGYCWIFPHTEYTSCGVYYDPELLSFSESKNVLDDMLDDFGLNYAGVEFRGFPVNCMYDGLKFDNVYLCGDAAGIVFPVTGEGISTAIESGSYVAGDILGRQDHFAGLESILKHRKRQSRCLNVINMIGNHHIQSLLFRLFIYVIKQSYAGKRR